MAQRRMFNKSITNSSRFLMMPDSAQNLYFHFGMNCDDDGFCEHFTIMRMTNAKPDDLKILQVRGFVHVFDDKVLLILDHKENNYIQNDRYTSSKYLEIYKDEIKKLSECPGGDIKCIQSVSKMDNQYRLGKDRLGKDIKRESFTPPTLEEVKAYCQERKNGVNWERWHNFYSAKGWMVGKNKMKDWKAAVRTWEDSKPKEDNMRQL